MLKNPLLEAMRRIEADYSEMPGLKLTAPQVQRLCGLPCELCRAALDALIRKRFLAQAIGGAYVLDGTLTSYIDRRPSAA